MPSRTAGLLVAISLIALPLAAADHPYRILEQAIEARASAVVLPSGERGILVVTRCTGCAPESFATGTGTRYLAASGPVALANLRAAARAAPEAGLTVFYDAQSRKVTRVVAGGDLARHLAPDRSHRPGAPR